MYSVRIALVVAASLAAGAFAPSLGAAAKETRKVAPGEFLEIDAGDTVFGTIRTKDDVHRIDVFLPSGAKFRAQRSATKGSRLSNLSGAVPSRPGYVTFDRALRFFGPSWEFIDADITGSRNMKYTTPKGRSGVHHLVHWGLNSAWKRYSRTGDFRFRTRVSPAKRVVFRGRPSEFGSPSEVVFGAYPGYDVSVILKWRGGEMGIDEITDPSGRRMTPTEPASARGNSIKLKGLTTTESGDHRIALDIGEYVSSWKVQIKLKGRPPARETIDARANGAADLPPLTFDDDAFGVRVHVRDTDAAPNSICFEASSPGLLEVGLVSAEGACELESFIVPENPLSWSRQFTTLAGERVLVHSVVRGAGGAVTAFVADIESALRGNGRVAFTDIRHDNPGGVSSRESWTEQRTFESTGETHTLEFFDLNAVDYLDGGDQYEVMGMFTVRHTDPSGATRDVHRVRVY